MLTVCFNFGSHCCELKKLDFFVQKLKKWKNQKEYKNKKS